MTYISEGQRVCFYLQKEKQIEMFLYTKSQIIRKNQDNFCYIFIYKNPDTLCYAIFHELFEIGGGGEAFLCKKTMHLALNFYMQKKSTFRYFFIYKKQNKLKRFCIQKARYFSKS